MKSRTVSFACLYEHVERREDEIRSTWPCTSATEVTNISKHGFWLLIEDRELFLPFEEFPWFEEAPVGAIRKVERPHPHHLHWLGLDVDLAVESIENPERHPLKAKIKS